DLRAGRRAITDRATADPLFELIHDLRRKSMRKQGEWLVEVNADHLPMSRGCVLAGRRERAASKSRGRRRIRWKPGKRLDIAESQPAQIGKPHRPQSGQVSQ